MPPKCLDEAKRNPGRGTRFSNRSVRGPQPSPRNFEIKNVDRKKAKLRLFLI